MKCNICEDIFDENFKLESHLKIHDVDTFPCSVCGKNFYMKWRLEKHRNMHERTELKFCHYYNNDKLCPFVEVGCMFAHEKAEQCKFKKQCQNKLCQFQHSNSEENSYENISDPIDRLKCDHVAKTEKDLIEHFDNIHDEWKKTEYFCNYNCRPEQNIHLCLDFENIKH